MRPSALGIVAHLAAGGAVASAACGPTNDAALPAAADAGAPPAPTEPGPAGVPDAARPPDPPYPAGPYGLAYGDVVPNITVQGYPLSRVARDPDALPFETIHLGAVRGDPTCQYVLLLWDFSGAALVCNEMRSAVTELVAKDPAFCGFEIVAHSADSSSVAGGLPPPPTRSDLDSVVDAFRESFPVGISTTSVRASGLEELPLFPDLFIIRKDDMRLVAFESGAGNTEQRVRDAIAHPPAAPARLATGLDRPRGLVADDAATYLVDATRGILRVPLGGGQPAVVAQPGAPPTRLALDADHVYWSSDAGGAGASVVARAPKAGGPAEVLTSASAGYSSFALDGATVWLTRTDGVVASVPATGGAETPLATNEPSPKSVTVLDGDVVWLAGGAFVSMPKTGGARTVLLSPSDFDAHRQMFSPLPVDVELLDGVARSGVLWARFAMAVPGATTVTEGITNVLPGAQPASFWTFLPGAHVTLAFGSDGKAYAGTGDGTGGFVEVLDPTGASTHPIVIFGQHDVPGLALVGGDAYWVDVVGATATGTLQRIAVP